MNAYEAGRILRDAGAVSGRDMTTEAAVAKLYYLFNVYHDPMQIKYSMERNIRGELTQKNDL
jgi:L-asparaginase